ncbi:hypothetical protein [Streptomyces sp. DT203]|uniref:hypothetical protein n=1 Tax=Streptomyces sp. DT203 TaxID=3393424 RepID=UPI003CF36EF8
MPTIAIVGAGPGLGLSLAKIFGRHGFTVHKTLAADGTYAANVAINLMIADRAPEGVPHRAPDDIAQDYWKLHTDRDRAEHVISA